MSWNLADAKIDRAHKKFLTSEIWEEVHLREKFYGTLIFQQSKMIYIHLYLAAILEGKSMPSKIAAKTTFCL